ncbi:MAG: ABC transporter ATP-binding protein [Planctomycetota bacterium]|jgi:ABC-2 type transport system ATP-binding protein
MEYAVETFSLTKTFSDWWGRHKVHAVDDLSLKINRNEVFGLLGPNGSGKTTTIKVLLGLLHPTKGKSLCLGGNATDPKISARIGFLPEESYLYKYLNARETLDFYGRLFRLDRGVRKTRIEALLDMVGLKAVANRAVGTYSKGMARRIGLAQALINDPDLLILDEPTTGLDPIGTRQIKDLIIKLAQRGKTVLLCSHLLADVEDVCDRIAILYGGKVQAKGRVAELLQQAHKRQITTDAISDEAVDKITQIVHAENAECEISSPMEKLETFFINTVAAAQRAAKQTDGAVSTTKIGDFLTTEAAAESILDKLVATPLVQEETAQAPPADQTEQPKVVEVRPDKELLRELTEPAEPLEPTPLGHDAETQPVQTDIPTQNDKVKKDLLDQLTARKKNETENNQDDEHANPGESADA